MLRAASVVALLLIVGNLSASPAATVLTTHSVPDEQGRLIQNGSGTVIARDARGFTVLSCAHVIESGGRYGKGDLTLTTYRGKTYAAKVLAYDRAADLSLMRVEAKDADVEVAVLAESEKYRPGLKLVKYGHPGGERLVRAEGVAADYSTESNGHTNLVATAVSRSGDSGGGVYRLSDRKFIGVIWGGGGDGLRAVRIGDVHEFVSKHRKKIQPQLAP